MNTSLDDRVSHEKTRRRLTLALMALAFMAFVYATMLVKQAEGRKHMEAFCAVSEATPAYNIALVRAARNLCEHAQAAPEQSDVELGLR